MCCSSQGRVTSITSWSSGRSATRSYILAQEASLWTFSECTIENPWKLKMKLAEVYKLMMFVQCTVLEGNRGSQHPYGYYVEQLIYNDKSTVSRTTLHTEPSFQPFTDLTEHLHPQDQIPAHRHHRKPPKVQFPHPWWVTAVPVVGGELHNISWVSCCRWSVWFLVAVTDSAPFHRKHSKVQRITFVPQQTKLAASVWTMTELQLSVWALRGAISCVITCFWQHSLENLDLQSDSTGNLHRSIICSKQHLFTDLLKELVALWMETSWCERHDELLQVIWWTLLNTVTPPGSIINCIYTLNLLRLQFWWM